MRTLLIAIALTLALASTATAATVADPDEPGFAQDVDIETATSSWWGPPGNVIITHTIKTYGRYSQRPCLLVVTNRGQRYAACDSLLINTTARTSPTITMTESPAGAPHTVTYRFTSSQIGNPRYYRWRASVGGYYGDKTVYTREDLPRLPFVDDDPFPPLDDPIDPPDLP